MSSWRHRLRGLRDLLRRHTRGVWRVLLVATLTIGMIGIVGNLAVERVMRAQLTSELTSYLDASRMSLTSQVRAKTALARSCAEQPDIRDLILGLARLSESAERDRAQLLRSTELVGLRKELRSYLDALNAVGFVVFDPAAHQIGALYDEAVGALAPPVAHEMVNHILQSSVAISQPFLSETMLPDVDGVWRANIPTLYYAAAVRNGQGQVQAVLAFRVLADSHFSELLANHRPGATGETYTFDRFGRILSASRFTGELQRIGLLPALSNSRSTLLVDVRDPGGNLLKGHETAGPRSALPLTRMAASAVQGETSCDVTGYRDYRGVTVIGAWTWLAELDCGLAHERDWAEAFAVPVALKRLYVAFGLFALATVGGAGLQARYSQVRQGYRQLEREKRAQERVHQRVVNAALDGFVLIDERGTIKDWNPQSALIFGWSREEAIGRELAELIVPARFREQHRQGLAAFLSTGASKILNRRLEIAARCRDGREIPIELTVTLLKMPGGYEFSAFVRDISRRKQVEEQARNHLAELAHVGRLSTVGEMSSSLVHELSQPLSAAANYSRGAARTLRCGVAPPLAELLRWIEGTGAQISRACEIVQRFAGFVRKGREAPSRIDVNDVVREVMALLAPGASMDTVDTSLHLEPALPCLFADRIQIEQVLVNLVRNACDAMIDGPEPRMLELRTELVDASRVRVSVRDSGCGIPADKIEQVFDPFFTTKTDGMGMGLSICRSIIEAHGGQLWAENAMPRGTVMYFTLPITET